MEVTTVIPQYGASLHWVSKKEYHCPVPGIHSSWIRARTLILVSQNGRVRRTENVSPVRIAELPGQRSWTAPFGCPLLELGKGCRYTKPLTRVLSVRSRVRRTPRRSFACSARSLAPKNADWAIRAADRIRSLERPVLNTAKTNVERIRRMVITTSNSISVKPHAVAAARWVLCFWGQQPMDGIHQHNPPRALTASAPGPPRRIAGASLRPHACFQIDTEQPQVSNVPSRCTRHVSDAWSRCDVPRRRI